MFWDSLNCLYFKVDCQWGAWTTGTCTKTCGGGSRTKIREKTVVESKFGRCIGSFSLTENCNTNQCPGRQRFFHSPISLKSV